MATRWGHALYQWLLERGWLPGPQLGMFQRGDRTVKDPVSKEHMNVYIAAKLHEDRTGNYPDFLDEENA